MFIILRLRLAQAFRPEEEDVSRHVLQLMIANRTAQRPSVS
jgi:hypothetical protein